MGKTVPRRIHSTHGPHANGADVHVARAFVLRRPIADPLAQWGPANGGLYDAREQVHSNYRHDLPPGFPKHRQRRSLGTRLFMPLGEPSMDEIRRAEVNDFIVAQ